MHSENVSRSNDGILDDFPLAQETCRPRQPDNGNSSMADADLARLTLRRLDDFIHESLANPSSEEAILGVTNARLMHMSLMLSDSIQAVLEDCPTNANHFEVMMQGINSLLRITRQVDRFSRLKLELSQARKTLEQAV